MLTHAAWLSHYGGKAEAIGSRFVRILHPSELREIGEIVGVLPAGVFSTTPELDLMTQILVLSPDRLEDTSFRDNWYSPLIRPRPGVTAALTQAALDAAVASVVSQGGAEAGFGLRLESLRNPTR